MIKQHIKGSIEVKEALLNSQDIIDLIAEIADTCVNAIQAGHKIILAGNGGSFADAQHISAEFTSRFLKERRSLASLALGCNNSAISAIGNDYGYEQAFARELSSIGNPGDVFIPISTSGNSPNILVAIEIAKERGLTIYGLTGKSGGKMASACICLQVPSDETPRIQECHILIGHIICAVVDETLSAS
jgi:D-sedoheptulose 7-phosphate isomerase